MRRGEVLRWTDVDLDAEEASVRQIRTVARYRVLTVTPKTDKGARTISLDPATVSALRAHTMAIYQHVLPGDDRVAAAVGARTMLGDS